jgi:undecaprenyl-diphosphatase
MLRAPLHLRHLMVGGLSLAAAGAFVFVATAQEVVQGGVLGFDRIVVGWIPELPPWAVEVVRDLTALGGPGSLLLVVALVIAYLLISRRWRSALLVGITTATGLAVCGVVKGIYDRPRPDLAIAPYAGGSDSFPSGHALMATLVYLTLAGQIMRLLPVRRDRACCVAAAVLIAGLVGVSRVLLRVHHPSDVVAGWSLGTVWAILCWMLARLLQRRGTVEDH